jgi:hypothetical protein
MYIQTQPAGIAPKLGDIETYRLIFAIMGPSALEIKS